MSAFMMDEKSIGKIASYIMQGYYYQNDKLEKHCKGYGYSTVCYDGIYRALEGMNIKALVARYGDDPEELRSPNIPPEVKIQFENKAYMVQLFKTARCYMYQCTEGDVPYSELYELMDKYAGLIASDIVEKMPEYEYAQWG